MKSFSHRNRIWQKRTLRWTLSPFGWNKERNTFPWRAQRFQKDCWFCFESEAYVLQEILKILSLRHFMMLAPCDLLFISFPSPGDSWREMRSYLWFTGNYNLKTVQHLNITMKLQVSQLLFTIPLGIELIKIQVASRMRFERHHTLT